MLRILALLLLIPLFDIMLLVVLARTIGAVETIAIVVLTALVGLMLARFVGRRNLRKIERSLRAGDIPTDRVLDGAMILAAAILFLTPGLVTDAIGLVLVFGPTRTPIRRGLRRWVLEPYVERRTDGFVASDVYMGGFPWGGGEREPIDVEVEVEDVDEGDADEGR